MSRNISLQFRSGDGTDFLPLGVEYFRPSCGRQNQEFKRELHRQQRIRRAQFRDEYRQLGIGKRFVVLLDRALLCECRPDPIAGIR